MQAQTLPSIQTESIKSVDESTLRRLLVPPKQVTMLFFFLQLGSRMLLLLLFVGYGDKL